MKKCKICLIDFDCSSRKEDNNLCFNCYEEKHKTSIRKREKNNEFISYDESKVDDLHIIFCDGSCRRNKKSGVGIVFKKEGEIIKTKSKAIKNGSCNEAEYLAVIESLLFAQKLKIKNISIRSDSSLVVNQINRKWRVRKNHLQVLFDRAHELLKWFDFWKIKHVKRNNNKLADSLAKKASS